MGWLELIALAALAALAVQIWHSKCEACLLWRLKSWRGNLSKLDSPRTDMQKICLKEDSKASECVTMCKVYVFFATGLPYPEGVYTAGESDQGGERRVQEGPGQSPEMIEMVKVQMQTRLFDVLDRCLCFHHLKHAETVQVSPFLGKKSVFFLRLCCAIAGWLQCNYVVI